MTKWKTIYAGQTRSHRSERAVYEWLPTQADGPYEVRVDEGNGRWDLFERVYVRDGQVIDWHGRPDGS